MSSLAHIFDEKKRTEDVIVQEHVTFESLLIPNQILSGLHKNGFRKPSPIQTKAIPVGRCGFDLIVNAKSGTGKTLVFSIIALESVEVSKCTVQVLVIAPTREIAIQIQDVLRQIGQDYNGLQVESFIGGLPLEIDKGKCKHCHIAVGTPGRIKQLILEKHLNVNNVQVIILDEADKLMEISFKKDIDLIYNTLPVRKQIITSSATYTNDLQEFLSNYMLTPTQVSVDISTPLLLGVRQIAYAVKPTSSPNQLMKLKIQHLLNIFEKIPFTQCIVFSNYQLRVESICNILVKSNWQSIFISGVQSQKTRLDVLNNFKKFKHRILVSTDLAARGIDVANIDLVINFDIPNEPSTYLHRMGRAGRYGSYGLCINLIEEGKELNLLRSILGSIGGNELSIPVISSVCENDILENDHFENYICGQSLVSNESAFMLKEDVLNLKRSHLKIGLDSIEKNADSTGTDNLLRHNTEVKDQQNIDLSLLSETQNKNDTPESSLKTDLLQKSQNLTNVVQTNKALFAISKLVTNIAQSDCDTKVIEWYLHQLKEPEVIQSIKMSDFFKDLNSKNSITQCIEWINLRKTKENKEDIRDTWENIFRFGYECSKTCSKSYKRLSKVKSVKITGNEATLNQNTQRHNLAEEGLIARQQETANTCEVSLNADLLPNSSKKYNDYFVQCSMQLWNNGLNFNDVQTFDEWFYSHWLPKVQFIRHYVQQNVYLEEMASFSK